jgi:SAM-dependent methyltransferase
MDESLRLESGKLAGSWMRHEPAWLRGYLVVGVEDPRRNLQSVLSRHFLIRALAPGRFEPLMVEEYRFAAVMNWLAEVARNAGLTEVLEAVLFALQRGADNAEGIEIPRFVLQTYAALPVAPADSGLANYLESLLTETRIIEGQPVLHEPSLNTFQRLWSRQLATLAPPPARLSVLEPACGSANDYRFLHSYGIARWVDYTGFDLCAHNLENARALFPDTRFEPGNIFEIAAPDRAFDLCFVHDLFEHLSLAGLRVAVRELARVTRSGACVGFFNMDEIPEHRVRPTEEYHWNTLSMAGMKALFAAEGFRVQVLHIGSFLRGQLGCEQTHNPNAYSFLLERGSLSL